MPITRSKSKAVSRRLSGGLVTGAEGRGRIKKEQQKAKERSERRQALWSQPRRFWMPPNSEREIIILDREPWAFRYEHALMNAETEKRDFFVPCIGENEDCPACHVDDREGAYVMYLSVLDLEPWTTRAGELVEYSRRLFVVKARQQNTYKRKYDALKEQGKTLRGCKVTLYRDDQKTPVTGNEVEWHGRAGERTLEEYVNEYTNKKGKHIVEHLGQPFDYEKLFPPMSRDELANLVGYNVATPGSAKEAEDVDDDVDGWDHDDTDTPWDDGGSKKTTRRTAKKTSVKPRARRSTKTRTRARA